MQRTQEALKKEGIDYRGVLYFGLMLTKEGPQVLEYNCRFGDPETQVILPLLESSLANTMKACVEGSLDPSSICWSRKSSCGVVMASRGYPGSYETGVSISGLEALNDEAVTVYYSGVEGTGVGNYTTAGGRVLTVTAVDDTLEQAQERAYSSVEKISFAGAQYRKDIAGAGVIHVG